MLARWPVDLEPDPVPGYPATSLEDGMKTAGHGRFRWGGILGTGPGRDVGQPFRPAQGKQP